jgi:DNA invertase Pin-like site-specific DNA recombinase
MADLGYARVSTRSQKEDSQIADLTAAGCSRIFTDKLSGRLASRPEWDKLKEYIRPGDNLIICRMARCFRNFREMIDVPLWLESQGCGFVVLRQAIDTRTATGRLFFHLIAAVDEWQREILVESTHEGLAVARAKGRTGGRPRSLTADDAAMARALAAQTGTDGVPLWTGRQLAHRFNCSPATISRVLRREAGEGAGG